MVIRLFSAGFLELRGVCRVVGTPVWRFLVLLVGNNTETIHKTNTFAAKFQDRVAESAGTA